MAPFEVQPERYLIKFTDLDPEMMPITFEHNYEMAVQLGVIEERYYQDKLDQHLNP